MTLSAISAFGDEVAIDLEQQIEVLGKHDVRALELRAAWGTNVVDLESQQLEHAARLLRAASFTVSAIGSPVGKSAIDGDFHDELSRLHAAFDAAKRLDTRLIRVFSFFIPTGGTTTSATRCCGAWLRWRERLRGRTFFSSTRTRASSTATTPSGAAT